MIDLHNHFLYGIDDGSPSLNESIEQIKKAQEIGITAIFLTPHYIKNTEYSCNNKRKKLRFQTLKKNLKKQNISVDLYLGNEVHICENLFDLIDQKEIYLLNNSRYLLLELPFHQRISRLKEVIFSLIRGGIVPILAHVERYDYFTEKDAKELLDCGCLFQGNLLSLKGKYGKQAEKKLKLFLRKNFIYFLASDAHRKEDLEELKGIEEIVKKIVKNDKRVEDMLVNHALKVIENKKISRYSKKNHFWQRSLQK